MLEPPRACERPRLTRADLDFWVLLSRIWCDWRCGLLLVKPDPVVGWSLWDGQYGE